MPRWLEKIEWSQRNARESQQGGPSKSLELDGEPLQGLEKWYDLPYVYILKSLCFLEKETEG